MSIPAFSIFSAVSELVVTAGVAVVVHRNWNRRKFPLALFLAVALFEALVNVAYMANRTARAASGADPVSSGMRLAFALHGMVSLLAHLSRIDVTAGTEVSRGQMLGLSGATGRVTGPHLHWALRLSEFSVDPLAVVAVLSDLKEN